MTPADSQTGMILKTPARCWQDALPTGSGAVGAMLYGRITHERLLFNHEDLYYPREVPERLDVSDQLPEVRRLIREGKNEEAGNHLFEVYKERMGGEASMHTSAGRDPYHPFCGLTLNTTPSAPFRGYRRGVEFDTGRAWVTWTEGEIEFTRELFVSRVTDTIHFRVRSNRPGTVRGKLALDLALDEQNPQKGATQSWSPEGGTPIGAERTVDAKSGRLTFTGTHPNGNRFSALARVSAPGGTLTEEDGALVVTDADELEIQVLLFPKGAVTEEKTESFDTAFAAHGTVHRELFERLQFQVAEAGSTSNEEMLLDAYDGDVPTSLIQTAVEMGRYLLISSSGPGGWPANLQGIWNGDYLPAWNSDFHTDENIQMNYWQALPGNLPETMLAFFDLFERFLDHFRENARYLFGCRGIFVPIAFTTNGYDIPRVWAVWTGAAGWIAQHFYDYYLFTGDKDHLANRAIPWLKETALFYEDFITEGEDGTLLFSPSMSPENHPSNSRCKVCENATMDVAICKEVLTHLCEGCEVLGIEKDGVKRWRTLLSKLPAYEVNEDGAMKEWLHPRYPDHCHHRHQSHVYPVFPGFEVTRDSDPEIFEACRMAVEKRLVIGLTSQTGWSMAHMANIYARLGDGDRALECIEILTRSSMGPNLLTYHNDWRGMGLSFGTSGPGDPPFQIDANLGITAAALEMLVFSKPGQIHLLPALPSKWKKGSARGILCRGGVSVDLKWNAPSGTFHAILTSQTDQTVRVRVPFRKSVIQELTLQAGVPEEVVC